LHYCHRKTFSRAIGKERIRLPVAWYTAFALAATPIDAEGKGFANGWTNRENHRKDTSDETGK
jgi:hypothetical protein